MYPLNASSVGWETEFKPNASYQSEGQSTLSTPNDRKLRCIIPGCTLSTAYLMVARSLPLVASHRLKALPLGVCF